MTAWIAGVPDCATPWRFATRTPGTGPKVRAKSRSAACFDSTPLFGSWLTAFCRALECPCQLGQLVLATHAHKAVRFGAGPRAAGEPQALLGSVK